MATRDPVNDVFNELIDIAIDTMLDTMQPEFKRMARQLVTDAQRRSHAAERKDNVKQSRRKQTYHAKQQVPVRRPQVTLYDTLEVSTRATPETIEAAYKSLARRHHPDVGGALTKMQEITNAYSVLKDKEARKKYDRGVGL